MRGNEILTEQSKNPFESPQTKVQDHSYFASRCWKRRVAQWSTMIIGAAISAAGIQLSHNMWCMFVLSATFAVLPLWNWLTVRASRPHSIYPGFFAEYLIIVGLLFIGGIATSFALGVSVIVGESTFQTSWQYFDMNQRAIACLIHFMVAALSGFIALRYMEPK